MREQYFLKKNIRVQSGLANMKFCICITYCVKQRNRITIINENIVSWSRKYDPTVLHALLIRSCVTMGELRLSIFRRSFSFVEKNYFISVKKKKKEWERKREERKPGASFLSRPSGNFVRWSVDDFYKRRNQALMIVCAHRIIHVRVHGSIDRSIDHGIRGPPRKRRTPPELIRLSRN